MHSPRLTCLAFIAVFAAAQIRTGLAQDPPRPAVPIDPIETIIEVFETHDLVALTTDQNDAELDFWVSLLRTPAIQAAVDDIVVGFGSTRYQGIMDRFTDGEDVPYNDLKNAWQQTTQPHHHFDVTMVEDFFHTLREVNASLPREQRIRSVLAEPPIDWDLIDCFDDLLPWLQARFDHWAEVVEQEVIARGRKALLISGTSRFWTGTPLLNVITANGQELFRIKTAGREMDLFSLQPDIADWPTPSLAFVRGTVLGAYQFDTGAAPPGPLEEHFDAIVYLAPPSSLTRGRIHPELCSDEEYLDMRLPRLQMAAANGAPGWLQNFLEYCGTVERR